MDPGAVPPALAAAVARVLADIECTTDVEWIVVLSQEDEDEAEADAEDAVIMCLIAAVGGSGYGRTVRCDEDEEAAAVFLADEWSEPVFETLADKYDLEVARRWPPCPRRGHDHALTPQLQRGQAVWACRDFVTPIGRLAESS
jgi:hypothetical protein